MLPSTKGDETTRSELTKLPDWMLATLAGWSAAWFIAFTAMSGAAHHSSCFATVDDSGTWIAASQPAIGVQQLNIGHDVTVWMIFGSIIYAALVAEFAFLYFNSTKLHLNTGSLGIKIPVYFVNLLAATFLFWGSKTFWFSGAGIACRPFVQADATFFDYFVILHLSFGALMYVLG